MIEKLESLYNSDEYPMHMPGHKRIHGFGQIDKAVDIDITEIVGYDDLYEPRGFIKEALDRASRLYGSDHTFFLVNGSTVGILTAIFSAINQHGRLLIARNCHKSVYNAAQLREADIDYIIPEITEGIFNSPDPLLIEKKLIDNRYEAIVITSPTYEGRVSNIKRIAEICHKYDTVLIVDEAHGAHFGFHERFAKSAVEYADIVVQSTHKTLPTLTQTGLLHINKYNKRINYEKVLRYLQIFQTSSPSYVLMSSIDSCLKNIELNGSKLWDDFFIYRDDFSNKLKDLKYLKLIETEDPCKIVISTRNTNICGRELSERLLRDYHIQLEMASATYIVAIVTCNDTEEGFRRFSDAIIEIDADLKYEKCEYEINDKYKHLLHKESQNNIYIYPPGIPIVAKGEKIETEALKIIAQYEAAGLKVRGIDIG